MGERRWLPTGRRRGRIALHCWKQRQLDARHRRCALETMIGIGVLLAGIGILWLCFALGVYFFTRTGREGMRIQRMEEERQQQRELSSSGTVPTGGSED